MGQAKRKYIEPKSVVTVTGDYTPTLLEMQESIFVFENTTNCVFTIPNRNLIPILPRGLTIDLFRKGAGEVEIRTTNLDILFSREQNCRMLDRFTEARVELLTTVSPDAWALYGDLENQPYDLVSDLDPITLYNHTSVLGPEWTFTRASTATYRNSQGVLTTAAVNEPRFEYDATLGFMGEMIEAAAIENFATYSEDTTNAVWTKVNGSVSFIGDGPDGSVGTANAFTENSAAGNHRLSRTFTEVNGVRYTAKVFVKAASVGAGRYFTLIANNLRPTAVSITIDPVTGQITDTTANTSTLITGVRGFANGWWEVFISAPAHTSGTVTMAYGASQTSAGGAQSYTGDSRECFRVFGLMWHVGSPASYIPATGASTATKAADVMSITTALLGITSTEYAVIFDITTARALDTGVLFSISDDTTAESTNISVASNNVMNANVVDGGVSQMASIVGTGVPFTRHLVAFAAAANDGAAIMNGGNFQTDVILTMPTVSKVRIGSDGGGASPSKLYLRRIRLFNKRVHNGRIRSGAAL